MLVVSFSTRPREHRRAPVSQNSTACWGSLCGRGRWCSPSSKGDARRTAIQPGSVDMLGPTARMPSDPSCSQGARGRTVAAIGALLCAP